jgi:hypothetical protein
MPEVCRLPARAHINCRVKVEQSPLWKRMPKSSQDLRKSSQQRQRDASRKQFKERVLVPGPTLPVR